jgi:hypothetical protein
MHRTKALKTRDQHDAQPRPRMTAPKPAAEYGLTPSEVHALRRSATLTAAQSHRRGVLPG